MSTKIADDFDAIREGLKALKDNANTPAAPVAPSTDLAPFAGRIRALWKQQGRRSQQFPLTSQPFVAFTGPRGSGTTRAAAQEIAALLCENPGSSAAVFGSLADDARDICFEGHSGLIPRFQLPSGPSMLWDVQKIKLTLPNGAAAQGHRADAPGMFNKHTNTYDFVWIDLSSGDRRVFGPAAEQTFLFASRLWAANASLLPKRVILSGPEQLSAAPSAAFPMDSWDTVLYEVAKRGVIIDLSVP